MFDWVGGRTSETSAVGLLPAALQGMDVREMLAGAALTDEANRNTVMKENPAALLAMCWYWITDGVGSKVNQGITVYGNKGSPGQHAYIQQLREGVHNFFVTFIEVLRDRPPGHDWELEPGVTCGDYLFGMLQGTCSALYANNRESISHSTRGVEAGEKAAGEVLALQKRVLAVLNEARFISSFGLIGA